MNPFVRDAFNYDVDEASRDTALVCLDESLTVQSQKDEADINIILDRFGVTNQLPGAVRAPTFEDFGDTIFDYRTALEQVVMAQDAFMSMPAKVRSEFDNDPQKFVEFCSDEKNAKRMEELGLLKEKPVVVPAPPPPS